MKYMTYRVRKMIWGSKGAYSIIMLELAIGITIFVSCLNLMLTNKDILNDLRKSMAQDQTTIYHVRFVGNEVLPDDLPVRYEHYLDMEEKYGDSVKIYYGAIYSGNYFFFGNNAGDDIYAINFLFLNNAMFESLFDFQPQKDQLYIGSHVLDLMEKVSDQEAYNLVCWGNMEEYDTSVYSQEKTNAVCDSFRIKDGKFVLSQGHELSCEPIPDEENTPYIDRFSFEYYGNEKDAVRLYIEDCVIGTADMLPLLSEDYKPYDSLLQVQYLDQAEDPSIIPTIVNWLNRERSGDNYQFTLTDRALKLEKQARDMSITIYQYMAVSLAIMAVVLIGTVGILLVLLNQRKKSMAVAYCCGATPWKSFLELYGEISSVFLAGGIFGLALSGGITPRLSAVESAADFYPVNIFFVILFCLAAALLCCGAALTGVDNKDPVKNLKEL